MHELPQPKTGKVSERTFCSLDHLARTNDSLLMRGSRREGERTLVLNVTCKENPNSECLCPMIRLLLVPASEPSFTQAFGDLPHESSSESQIMHWGRDVQRHSGFAQEQLDIFLLLRGTGTKRWKRRELCRERAARLSCTAGTQSVPIGQGTARNTHSSYKMTTKQRDGSSSSPRAGTRQPRLAKPSLQQVQCQACLRTGSGMCLGHSLPRPGEVSRGNNPMNAHFPTPKFLLFPREARPTWLFASLCI